jgi:hypothetical protein
MKHLSEDQLILRKYGELPDRTRVEAHLAECEHCRREKAALDAVLETVSSSCVPERPETYGQEVWRQLAPRLEAEAACREIRQPARTLPWSRWSLGVAAVASVALAFLAGRFWPRHQVPSPPAISQEARNRVLMAELADHFERAEILLTALKHAGPEGGRDGVDISFERELAQDLVIGNQLYEQSVSRAGQAGLASVLDDLERVLLTIAHEPASVSPAELAVIRQGIQQEGILFKIQVLDSRLRDLVQAGHQTGRLAD